MTYDRSAPTVLQKIAASVEIRLNQRKKEVSVTDLENSLDDKDVRPPFRQAFLSNETHIISEVKFRSPALGVLETASSDDAVKIAGVYLNAGASAISILTEMDHFHGSADYFKAVRKVYPDARLLMKDFVIDEYQLLEARAMKADAALLIVALLGETRTKELLRFAQSIQLSTLVEVHDEAELESAFLIGADLVGVNNRDLKTLTISIETSTRLAPKIPKDRIVISESGITSRDEILKLEKLGYRGFLVGGSLMTSANPGLALQKLLGTSL
jgi:indole-3-glycerol phosphate synthase